ncbi:SDR family oxidoreductase [Gordonia sp. HNM0687]|uniref:SDR family oxidoreductase n=1 Tax=Gordonia mangrovi TaxID=2665643 RepID=A0A6L7GKG7_9ACTN|nr:SDR family NAD(P)-dependent oxidoreductase [Gordonia mangrovi]MXP20396.1 SDR family oxidoreductase [Gordonia mangrovi]UVF79004.1 SDR family oxidoreductase [Gordonia mangrovi]
MTRTAVVVGGASGIGLATAKALAAEEFSLVIADVNADAARTAADHLGARAVTLDVTDESSVAAGFETIGAIDAVVSCAGLTIPGALTELELEHWQTTIDVCLTGSFLVLKHAGQHIVDGGSIIVISSLNGRQPGAGMGAYCASKAAVTMLVEVAALEMAPRKVRVNAISPGLIDTPLTEGLALVPGLIDEYVENTPLGRSGRPEEIADMAVFLASEKAAWITGAAFDVNGGAHLQRYPDVLGKMRALMS